MSGLFIVGGGAIGFSLAAHLNASGKLAEVLRIHTAAVGVTQKITVKSSDGCVLEQSVISKPLSSMSSIKGLLLITAKAKDGANKSLM